MVRPVVLVGALVAALGAFGCEDPQLAQVERVRTEVCACKVPACTAAAMAKLPKDGRSDQRTQALAREMLDCVSKVNAAALAKANEDPDAGSGGAGGSDEGSDFPVLTRP